MGTSVHFSTTLSRQCQKWANSDSPDLQKIVSGVRKRSKLATHIEPAKSHTHLLIVQPPKASRGENQNPFQSETKCYEKQQQLLSRKRLATKILPQIRTVDGRRGEQTVELARWTQIKQNDMNHRRQRREKKGVVIHCRGDAKGCENATARRKQDGDSKH